MTTSHWYPINTRSTKETLPFIWEKGLCEVCGIILNVNTYVRQGARVYCSFECSDSFWLEEYGEIKRHNHASSEDRAEMAKEIAKRKNKDYNIILEKFNKTKNLEFVKLKNGNNSYHTKESAKRFREAGLVDINWEIDQLGKRTKNANFIKREKLKKIRIEVLDRIIISYQMMNNHYGSSDYMLAIYRNLKCHMTLEDYDHIKMLEKKGIYVGAKDTLFIDENGDGHLCNARDISGLREEMEDRKNKTLELITLTNGNTVYVDSVKYRELEKEGKLRYTNETSEREEGKVSNLPEKYKVSDKEIDKVLSETEIANLECLDARSMIERYIQNENQISGLYGTISDMRNQLDAIKEPEVIEDISVWNQYRLEKQSMKELAKSTESDSLENVDTLSAQNRYIVKLLRTSEDIPHNKWIRSGDVGMFVDPTDVDYQAVSLEPWDQVKKRLKEQEKRKKKEKLPEKITSTTGLPDSTLKTIGGVSLLTLAIAPAVTLGLVFGTPLFFAWIVGFSIMVLIFGKE